MNRNGESTASKKETIRDVLDVWDRYELVIAAARRGEDNAETLRETGRELEAALEADRGTLGTLYRETKLEAEEVCIILLLLRRLLSDSGPGLKGKKILRFFFTSTFSMLQATRYLEATGWLRTAGIVDASEDAATGRELLESQFRLTDSFFEHLRRELVPARDTNTPVVGFGDNTEYLLALKKLVQLYRRRSEEVFRIEDDMGPSGSDRTPHELQREIDRHREMIAARLEAAPDSETFAAVRFQKDHRLSDEEMVLATMLLFHELHNGNAFLETVDLVRLVSRDERDLIGRRSMLTDKSQLVRSEIVVIEESTSVPDSSCEIGLSPWAFDALIGEGSDREAIDADLKLDFHQYLQGIDDSHDFFAKLRLPPNREA